MLSNIIRRTFATTGSLLTWGATTYGWGRPVTNDLWTPGFVHNFDDIQSVATGQYHLGFITKDKTVYTVGLDDDGRLGHTSTNDTQLPRKVSFDAKAQIKQLSLGCRHSLALTQSGEIYSWGYSGALGVPADKNSTGAPTLIPSQYFNNNRILSIGAGRDFSAALCEKGHLFVWGTGLINLPQWKQDSVTPVQSEQISELLHKRHATIKKFFAIDSFLILLLDNGRLYCRGINNGGIFGARTNPLVMSDLQLSTFAKTYDQLYKNEKIVDAQASSNSIIFRTESNKIFYSGMNVKFQPTPFPLQVNVKKMFATQSSVGVITTDNKIYYLNQKLVDDSDFVCKKNRVFLSQDENLSSQILDFGGKYHLRYALVK